MKIRTISDFQDALDKEFGWRFKEIADLKTSVSTAKSLGQRTVIRAGVALLYAHWEGFIKKSSEIYISYLIGQRVQYSHLKTPLVAMGMKAHLNVLRESGVVADNAAIIEFLRTNMNERFAISLSGAIRTEANLNSVVFKNIVTSLCLPISHYEAKFNLIDESLLARRNSIAHGEYLDVNAKDWRGMADEIMGMLRGYKTDLENAASTSSYRLTAS